MLISGTRHRSIYPQDTVNWVFNLRPVSTGLFNFNFISNSGDVFTIFSLKDRKIYSTNNDFIGSYDTNATLSLSGSVTNDRIDLYNNENRLYLGLPISQYDKITGFSLNSVGGNNINFLNLNILGDRPQYFYDESVTYRSGELIKINIVNNSDYDFNIFSGTLSNSNFLITGINNLKISQNNSGYFYLINNGGFANFSNTNIILDTDFGRQELRITLSGIRLEDETYYLSVGPNVLPVFNDFYQDYSIVFRNADSANLSIELKHVSGITGDYFRPVQRTAFLQNQEVSGFIAGSGFLFGGITGEVSGFNSLRNDYEYGTGFGIARDFKIAEDQFIEKDFNILGSGLGDAYFLTNIRATGSKPNILFSGDIGFRGGLLTGFFSGIVSGLVPDAKRGWLDTGDGIFSPPPISEQTYNLICSTDPTNFTCSAYQFLYEYKTALKTGFFTKFFNYTGNIFLSFDPSEYETINLVSPTLFVTGLTTGFFNITGVALATGERVSGKLIGDYLLDFEPGYWNISKPYIGPITGKSFLPSGDPEFFPFDPILGIPFLQTTTGFFSGIVSSGFITNFCDPRIPAELLLRVKPEFIFRDRCFKDDSNFFFQYTGLRLQPVSGEIEKFYENSVFQIASGTEQLYDGHPTGGRIRISRLGATPSGSGYFYNTFYPPLNARPPAIERIRLGISETQQEIADFYLSQGWEENFNSLEAISLFDLTGLPPSITDIDIECNFQYPCDSTIIYFTVGDPNFYQMGGKNVNDCWLKCFSHWPRKQYSIEDSGSINNITKPLDPIFNSDGFNYLLEFDICNINTISEKTVKLRHLNPSVPSVVRYERGDEIFIYNNNNYSGNYYINSVAYSNNFRNIDLKIGCDKPNICPIIPDLGRRFFVYDEVVNVLDSSWCRISSSSSS
jgi:hypothetical protein